jgi:Predicted membrane protein
MKKFTSDISGNEYPESERVTARLVRKSILDFIKQEHPDFENDKCMSADELRSFREKYISEMLLKETGELSDMEQMVLDALNDNTILSDKLDDEIQEFTFGQKIADKVASFGGSWTFIISFMTFLLLWIAANVFMLANKGFDPYPFILLNLILSCIAALQAPVIMMSQNRQEEKDRDRAKKDYMINLKSELEIRMLHEKIDHLLLHQEQSIVEIQKVQMDMMEDILKKIESSKKHE